MGFIDSSVTAIALPSIRADLGASLTAAQWIGSAYLLALAALVLTGGAMGDRFGVARVFGLGIAGFVAASVACALAPNASTLVAARLLQGVSAGAMVPGSMALVARTYPRAERGRALGIWASASAMTTASGPILGGLVVSLGPDWAWRLLFAINLPLGIGALALLRRHVRRDAGRPGTRVDWVGAMLATTGLALLTAALTQGRVSLAVPGAAILGLFIWHETRAKAPMLRLTLFRNRAFASINAATFCLWFALSAILFYLPMTAVAGWGLPEAQVTLALLPIPGLVGLLSTPAGRLADRIGAGPMIGTGGALVTLAYAGLALFSPAGDFWGRILPCMVVAGLGMATLVAPLTASVMAAVEDDDQGAASGINNAIARLGGLLAVSLLGGVAAAAYARAGGPVAFAAPGLADTAHRAATGAGFAAIATLAALFAATGALIATLGLRRN